MGPKRILAISDLPDRPEMALLAGLVRQNHQVTLVSRLKPGALAPAGVSFISHAIPARFSLNCIKLIRKLAANFDIVHCFSARALTNTIIALHYFNPALKNKAPKIIAYRGTVGHLARFDPSAMFSFLHPRVAAISCVSNAVKKYLTQQGVASSKLHTIYKGHEPAWYQRKEAGEFDLRTSLGMHDTTCPLICFVGNMRAVKGADLLIEAFSQLNHARAHLVLVGAVRDSAVRNAIERSARAFNIHLLGPRADAPEIVRGCTVSVMPSRSREGLPKAVIEAMLLRKPVIISDAGGMPEMLTDGESGLIFQAGNREQLTENLRAVVDDAALQSKLGDAAFERAKKQFSVMQMIAKTQEMYAQVCTA